MDINSFKVPPFLYLYSNNEPKPNVSTQHIDLRKLDKANCVKFILYNSDTMINLM